MKRAVFYIDGFNLYHALPSDKHKWLDLSQLATQIVANTEHVTNICYFTALCSWNMGKRSRHQNLIDIYKDLGIEVILGRFKEVTVACNKAVSYRFCDHQYQRHAEKQTDVNIAIRMLKDAYEDKVDRAYLLSHDSDLIPVLKSIQSLGVQTMLLFPPNTQNVDEFKSISFFRKLKNSDYDNAILPNPMQLSDGRIMKCPCEWQ